MTQRTARGLSSSRTGKSVLNSQNITALGGIRMPNSIPEGIGYITIIAWSEGGRHPQLPPLHWSLWASTYSVRFPLKSVSFEEAAQNRVAKTLNDTHVSPVLPTLPMPWLSCHRQHFPQDLSCALSHSFLCLLLPNYLPTHPVYQEVTNPCVLNGRGERE